MGFDDFLSMDEKNDIVYKQDLEGCMFKTSISFHILIDHIKKEAQTDDSIRRDFAESILAAIEKNPELKAPIYNNKIIEKHRELIHDMMMFVFPRAFYEKQMYAATTAYLNEVFYATPKFKDTIKVENGRILGELNIDIESFNFGKTINSFLAILQVVYGLDINMEFPLVYRIPDPETGLDRYFKMNLAVEFMDMIIKKEIKPFTEKEKELIKTKIYDIDFLKKMVPVEDFEFSGFMVLNAINITVTEILSAIKKDLIERETVTTMAGFLKLQHKLRSLLKIPDLMLGLADYPGSPHKIFTYGHNVGNSFILNKGCAEKLKTIKGSIYELAFNSRKIVIAEDLTRSEYNTDVEKEIIKLGIKSILVAPLFYNNEIIGILELGAPKPGQINKVNVLVMREILGLFAMAVARGKDELNSRIEAIIKEKCTAIHPTLEWKFRNAAMNLIRIKENDPKAEMEEIVFHDVYPLFGLTDIRDSSVQRNDAIRSDLIENLELAKDVFVQSKKNKKLKILDEIIFEIDKKIDSLKFGLSSADESETLRFLNKKIIPHFDHLKTFGPGIKKIIDNYFLRIDPNFGFVYKKRKSYDESVSMISNMIAEVLDEEQAVIQKIFPHYFERYKTDGVDHNIYIGQSLVENEKFNKIYLKNIRLWQLLTMCRIIRKANVLKNELPVSLETASLLLVQDSPLSIRFRYDEKKFDVDGAYNVRYEIMKKRIDKAEIKGMEERLTQPGKIAIVFSQTSEAQEYLEYIEYLQANKYLNKGVEDLEIEDLQGIRGLRALRVSVNLKEDPEKNKISVNEIKEVVSKMSAN